MNKRWAIVNTRPIEQASAFEKAFCSIDADVLHCSTTRCELLCSDLSHIQADLIVLTSQIAVHLGMPRLTHLYKSAYFTAIGKQTFDVLETYQVPYVLPYRLTKTNSSIWWQWFLSQKLNFTPKRVLVVQCEGGYDYLFNAFRSAGFGVHCLLLYRHVNLPCPVFVIQQAFEYGKRCVWVLMSARAVNVLKDWSGDHNWDHLFSQGVAVCVSERVGALACDLWGDRIKIIEQTSMQSVVKCLIDVIK